MTLLRLFLYKDKNHLQNNIQVPSKEWKAHSELCTCALHSYLHMSNTATTYVQSAA